MGGEVANAMAKKSKRGRKSKWETHVLPNLDRIPKWRRDGMTEEQICKKLDVGVSTFNRYKKQYRELREALKKGKEHLIEELEDSLYKKAMGFAYEETKTYISKDDDGKARQKVEKYKKYAQPDTGALAFALKNLAPDKWKDRHDIEHKGSLEVKNDDSIKRIEQQLEQDDESRELLKEFFRRSKEYGEDGEGISEG